MLNKELLLMISKKGVKMEPTHTIYVSEGPARIGFNLEFDQGDINPKDFLGLPILEVSCDVQEDTIVRVQGTLNVKQLYLGRLDTKEVVILNDVKSGYAKGNVPLFNSLDAYMDIPIYIGENPPPWA